MRDPVFKEWWMMSEGQYQRWSFATDVYDTHSLACAHTRVHTHAHTHTHVHNCFSI